MNRFLALVSFAPFLALAACAGNATDQGAAADEAALTSLNAATCATPNAITGPLKDASGNAIAGGAITTLNGCILGKTGETGAATMTRATAILNDTQKFSTLTNDDKSPTFSKFSPLASSGTPTTGTTQEVDVSLAGDFTPSGRLLVKRKMNADGSYDATITNSTDFKATILFFPVTALKAGDLKLTVKFTPQANGLTAIGQSSVILQQQQDMAPANSQLVSNLFPWLQTQLQ